MLILLSSDCGCFISTCRSFGLSFCDSLTDQSLIYMQSMVNLVSLTLKKGTEFSAEGLKELFEHLHPQRTGSATGLLHVNVAECTNLNDMAVKALADRYWYLRIIQEIENMYCVSIKFLPPIYWPNANPAFSLVTLLERGLLVIVLK